MLRHSHGCATGFRFISSSPLLLSCFSLVSFIGNLQGKYFAEGCGRSKKEAKNASAKVPSYDLKSIVNMLRMSRMR